MAERIVMQQTGAPEVMQIEPVDLPEPSVGEVQIRQTAIGLNYMDVYQRSGYYPMDVPHHSAWKQLVKLPQLAQMSMICRSATAWYTEVCLGPMPRIATRPQLGF